MATGLVEKKLRFKTNGRLLKIDLTSYPARGARGDWYNLWDINHCRLFHAKFSLYIYIKFT